MAACMPRARRRRRRREGARCWTTLATHASRATATRGSMTSSWPPTPDRPTSRCSTRRSAPTSPGPSPRTATSRRSSPATRACGGRTPSSPSASTGCARGLLGLGLEAGDRVGLWSPNYAEWTLLQYATAEIGVILVNVNPAYRTHELAVRARTSRAAGCCSPPRRSRRRTTSTWSSRSRPDVPALERAVFFWEDDWDELVAGAGGVGDDAARRPPGAAATRRPDQHPVHVGHDRVPEGRHPHPPQHPQQRLLRGPPAGVPGPATGCASRCPSTTASAW